MNFESKQKNASQTLITVIVPLHNMADRLSNLFLWLREADRLNFQVILVCNKCSDDTKSQLEKFINTWELKNALIVECEEIGPGNARNYGKIYTEGKFTLFWDSDDIGYPQKVIEIIHEAEGADALVANYSINMQNEASELGRISEYSFTTKNDFMNNPGLWRIIFKSEAIQEINFGISRMGEDQVFISRFLATNPSLKFSHTYIYRYFIGIPNQLTSVKVNMDGLSLSLSEIKNTMLLAPLQYLTTIATFFIKMCLTGMKRGRFLLKVMLSFQLLKFLIERKSIDLSFRQKILILGKLVRGRPNEY
jgi:glycosyltransferase involved in cell wall biosynthesis